MTGQSVIEETFLVLERRLAASDEKWGMTSSEHLYTGRFSNEKNKISI
jgi:hypothetical protein